MEERQVTGLQASDQALSDNTNYATNSPHARALLELIASLDVELLTCPHCQGRWLIPFGGPALLFHRCNPRRSNYTPEAPPRDAQARLAWARHHLGAGLLDAFTAKTERVIDGQLTCHRGHTGPWAYRNTGRPACIPCANEDGDPIDLEEEE